MSPAEKGKLPVGEGLNAEGNTVNAAVYKALQRFFTAYTGVSFKGNFRIIRKSYIMEDFSDMLI